MTKREAHRRARQQLQAHAYRKAPGREQARREVAGLGRIDSRWLRRSGLVMAAAAALLIRENRR